MGLNPKGRNWGSLVNWDDLGKAYAGFILAWTITLISGAVWLLLNRRVPFIRMRNLPLAFASTAFLHVYLVKIMLAYTTNGHFLCSAEFWIMSIYLPFGIALYQANITQLLSTSSRQHGLLLRQLSSSSLESATSWRKITGIRGRWSRLTAVERSYILIGIAMLAQLIITAALYATSPILQGDWSSFGKISHAKGQAKCRKSVEWVPSAFWQLFWSWIYGPYILYRIRNIKDAHYWRISVILSIVCGLPGTPLWITAVFNTAFKPVNRWFVPPMWLAPGIVVMQFTTIFVPIYEYYEYRVALAHITRESSLWEKDGQQSESSESTTSSSQRNVADRSTKDFFEGLAEGLSGKDMYRMPALERALQLNPSPLLRFAATKDFTAENIIFLMHIAAWRAAWASASRNSTTRQVTATGRRELFIMALDIYMASVCDQTAEVPINIEGPIAKTLRNLFEPHMPSTRTNSQTSLASSTPTYALHQITDTTRILPAKDDDKDTHIAVASIFTSSSSPPASPGIWKEEHGVPHVQAQAEEDDEVEALPQDFDEHVFDRAEASVKYLVLTNTWRKFVQSRHDAMRGSEA